MALPTSRKPAPSNNRWRCPSRPSEKTCWTPRDVPGEGRGGFEVLRRMPHGREQAPVARDSRALAQRVDHEAGRAPRAVGGPQRDVVRAEGPRPAAPVTARAGAGARSGRDRGRGRAWAAARRGRARGRAPGRARADGWAGWDAARPRLCTPLGSRPRPLHEPLKPHLASPPTRSIASGVSADAQHSIRCVAAQRVRRRRWRHHLGGEARPHRPGAPPQEALRRAGSGGSAAATAPRGR